MKMRNNHKGFRSFIFAVLTTILFSLTMMPLYGVAATWYVAPADAGGDDSIPEPGGAPVNRLLQYSAAYCLLPRMQTMWF